MLTENVQASTVAGQIQLLTPPIDSLPADIVFYTETDPNDILLDCQPATITSVTDDTGRVKCTGVTQGSVCYCNFTMPQGSISTTVEEICFTAYITLYLTSVDKQICIPVSIGTAFSEKSLSTIEKSLSTIYLLDKQHFVKFS